MSDDWLQTDDLTLDQQQELQHKLHLNLQKKEFEKMFNAGYRDGVDWANTNLYKLSQLLDPKQDNQILVRINQRIQTSVEAASSNFKGSQAQ